ncbi:MAG: hypothetical protein ABF651_10105 [Sporolactobacillus sp.]
MVKSLPLVKHFLQTMLYYKINFIASLGVPVFYLIYNLRNELFHNSSVYHSMSLIISWTAYMIVVNALLSSGPAFIILREDQFMKMFHFITGNSYTIIFAKFVAQFLVMLVSVLILDLLCGLLFFLPFFKLFGISVLLLIFCSVPIFFLFLIFTIFPVRQETVLPFVNILLLLFIYLTSVNYQPSNRFVSLAWVLINPVQYADTLGGFLLNYHVLHLSTLVIFIVVSMIYLVIGLLSLSKIRINPIFRS